MQCTGFHSYFGIYILTMTLDQATTINGLSSKNHFVVLHWLLVFLANNISHHLTLKLTLWP